METQVKQGQITQKMYLKIIISFVALIIFIPLMMIVKPLIRGWSAYQLGSPKECTAINIRCISDVRDFINVTTFLTEDNTEIEIESSYKDYVGRKTVILVYKNEGCRKNYEFPKLSIFHILVLGLLVFCWVAIFYCRITKKLVVVKE